MCIELAVLIVDLDVALCNLGGQEDILGENRAHCARALIDAAPGLDVARLGLSLSNYHIDWLLTDDHDLLEFHFIMLIIRLQGRLNVVLDLGLGLLSTFLMLELQGGRNIMWELRLEVNLVDTWLEHAALDIKHAVFVLEELFLVLELIGVVHGLVTVLGRVVANETALLSTLDLKLNMRSLNCLHDLNVDHADDSVSWLVEGILGLNLDFTLGELSALI